MTENRSAARETCERCGEPYAVWFAPASLWNAVNPPEGLLCPRCFGLDADEHTGTGALYAPEPWTDNIREFFGLPTSSGPGVTRASTEPHHAPGPDAANLSASARRARVDLLQAVLLRAGVRWRDSRVAAIRLNIVLNIRNAA